MRKVKVTGIAVISALGLTPEEHQAAMARGQHGLRPLSTLGELGRYFPTCRQVGSSRARCSPATATGRRRISRWSLPAAQLPMPD